MALTQGSISIDTENILPIINKRVKLKEDKYGNAKRLYIN